MTSLWGINRSPSPSTEYQEQWKCGVGTKPKQYNKRPAAEIDAGPSRITFGKEHLSNRFIGHWNGLDMRQSTFTGQRSTSKRHYDMPGDDEPRMKRMAAGLRKLQITDDDRKPCADHDGSSNELWGNGRVFGANISQPNQTWKQDLDDRLDMDSDESGCEEDQPQLIVEKDFLNALKLQNSPSSLPPQILSNIRESTMQLVLWKPIPFPGLCDNTTNEEDDSPTSTKTADSKPNAADDNMAESPVDEDMDL